ncbi:WG repeat-containing protein [Moraxella porci]|uniref:WG repeat-containing protein n=1 Tax=Moraxella porci TaxID=1288392 RepID=UPI00244AC361|nr:WG repeat-containing protein [Moraxella porci]MDH2272514.1 WG repeat-containing protein [Moraxella porci]
MIKLSMTKTLIAVSLLTASLGSAYACTPPKSHFKNTTCTSQGGVFLATKDNGQPVALLDARGNKTADLFAYQAALPSQFAAGIMPVLKNGKVGYINAQGKVVIGFEYDRMPSGIWARGVREDRLIAYANGRFVVLASNGRLIRTFDRSVSQITDYVNGVASVTQSGQRYDIDKQGNRIQPPVVSSSVSNTAASPNQTRITSQTIASTQPTTTSRITTVQSSAKSSSAPTALIKREQNGKWGFVDAQGNLRVLYAFDEVRDYAEGLAAVRQGNYWGFIDEKADLVIPFQFHKDGIHSNSAMPNKPARPLIFENGKAWIGNLGDGSKMCITKTGINSSCS